ncbi:hypothetical protein TOT_020000379 [Theileria orientalis strain Shintoku]|uniref:Uncharacterized protein n=1 Tax=Theileria orientalis strain Shintoku TaxID=869250 RepID=J4C3A8_THEOR|nr:hypothetical protein TOT_020000379 [Theileria orientalis strain Shintoku]BAM40116.1 hypothetical protein TOT_020000379 [Theileria orientalis strain Shintoku]|eukprot:XP_009690417.1 hypothetical protein TOT_020000379 [Theileria orientalis strain Shintoku]
MSVRIDALGPTPGQICYEISGITLLKHYIAAFVLVVNFTVIIAALAFLVRVALSLRTLLVSALLSNLKRVAYFNAHRSITRSA